MADLTLTVPDNQVDRVRQAVAIEAGGDPQTFTAEDVRQFLIQYLIGIVRNVETTAALNAIQDTADTDKQNYVPPVDPGVT